MGNFVGTVKGRIHIAILTAIDICFAPRIKLAVRSKIASSVRDAISIGADSEREERIEIFSPLENVSEKDDILHVMNANDEIRNIIPATASEFPVPGTHFDQQPLTHQSGKKNSVSFSFSV